MLFFIMKTMASIVKKTEVIQTNQALLTMMELISFNKKQGYSRGANVPA